MSLVYPKIISHLKHAVDALFHLKIWKFFESIKKTVFDLMRPQFCLGINLVGQVIKKGTTEGSNRSC